MNKRKKPAKTYHFPDRTTSAPDASGVPSAGPSTTGVLREKTRIRQSDGRVLQTRSVVEVTADAPRPVRVHPDVPRERAPIYDLYDGGGGEEGAQGPEDDEPREARESDDPLRQWAGDHLHTYLAEMLRLEGRGKHALYPNCPRCASGTAEFRCSDCLGGGELLCSDCLALAHKQLPFHRIQKWTGETFERRKLKDVGVRIQLGHWHGATRSCAVPIPARDDDFVIIDVLGVHQVGLDFCGCGQSGLPTVQLLRAGLWAATTTSPKTAATFALLRKWHLLSFEAKLSALEFYQSLARETDNLSHKKDKDRYHEFVRMTKQWRNVRMLKRAGRGHDPLGIANTAQGECALLCPACPQPDINMSPDWASAPADKHLLLTRSLDFSMRYSNGWAFFCEVKTYMSHVKKFWNQKQPRSHCVAHDAVDKPDRESRGTASSGIGAVDCARHNMKRPNAVGDLQLGERYVNMDYLFFRSLARSSLIRLFVSYDIACQWHINIWIRMHAYQDVDITIGGVKYVTFLVPKFHLPAHIEACNLKFSFNLTRDVGQTDGEAPERGWANANPLARSTKEMGPGSRRDTLDDHFNDVNYKKIIALGYMLRKKTETAVPEMVRTQQALDDMEGSLGERVVKEWTTMAELWEADDKKPNPFETLRKDLHVAKVRAELAEEAAAKQAAGLEDAGSVRGEMHLTELIGMGLQLQDQQRILAFDVAATGLHPTPGQRRAMTERTSKLGRKIVAWIDVQEKFFPGLKNVRELEDAARARAAQTQPVAGVNVYDVKLWLPSAVARAPWAASEGIRVPKDTHMHEYRLRVGQAEEALHELRRLLLVRTHLYQLKDVHASGVRANMRSQDKISALNNQAKRSAAQYRTAREALVTLGPLVMRAEWERTLLELHDDYIRGLPQSHFHDPHRKQMKKRRKKKRKRAPRPPSWIWVTTGAQYDPADGAAMNEAVRIEWAKIRARAHRWREEVDLLEEEMGRVGRFLKWRSDWWTHWVGARDLPEGPQLEGETAYALRQAGIHAALAERFTSDWASLPDLIRRGRAGELEVADIEEEEEEEERDRDYSDDEDVGAEEGSEVDSEDEAVPNLPSGELSSTHVDEVLVM
ncbi:hypothetical protein C8R47DRAFT_1172779 [Mycena vitilis]|nr:hypothetical protein C8R47DRAFT_1172779 [Mycena vitilis]